MENKIYWPLSEREMTDTSIKMAAYGERETATIFQKTAAERERERPQKI